MLKKVIRYGQLNSSAVERQVPPEIFQRVRRMLRGVHFKGERETTFIYAAIKSGLIKDN